MLNKIFFVNKGPIRYARDMTISKINQNLIVKRFLLNFADNGFFFDNY